MIGGEQMDVSAVIRLIEEDPKIYQLLKHCPYDILRQWKLAEYPRGSTVFRQGDVQDCLYIIVEGSADIHILAENGREYSLTVYQKGDLIGELEIFERKPFVCNVKALTDLKLIGLERGQFFRWLELDMNLNRLMIQYLSKAFYNLSQKVGDDTLYSLYHRVCSFLVESLEHGGKAEKEPRLNVNKTQLSSQFAVTQRSVNRILQSLKEKGIIDIHSQGIIVRDVEKLKEEKIASKFQ
jgi:CRP-like cAMP-binding protein